MAAVCAGLAQSARLAWLCPRAHLQTRRHPGRLGGAGRPCAPAQRDLIKNMKRLGAVLVFLIVAITDAGLTDALAASGQQPQPAGAVDGAPAEYTRFSVSELQRGFLALAFGSDLRIGLAPRGIRRFDHPIRATIVAGGSVDRSAAMARVIDEYARKVPNLRLSLVS